MNFVSSVRANYANILTLDSAGNDVLRVATGAVHSCAVISRISKNIMCWGRNNDGQLGIGSFRDTNVPTFILDAEGLSGLCIDTQVKQ